jgi:hypothetical protein
VLNPPDVPEDHYFLTPHSSLGQVLINIISSSFFCGFTYLRFCC